MDTKLRGFVLSVYIVFGLPVITAHNDPSNKIMEDFSGYPIHEPQSQDSLLSLSVDSEGLQKQVSVYVLQYWWFLIGDFFVRLNLVF